MINRTIYQKTSLNNNKTIKKNLKNNKLKRKKNNF